MPKLDLTRPYHTREGGEAKAVKGPDGKLYGYFITLKNGEADGADWDSDGKWWKEDYPDPHQWDLVNVPEPRTVKVWFNVYSGPLGWSGYLTRSDADRTAAPSRIACIEREITFTVGEGLSDEPR